MTVYTTKNIDKTFVVCENITGNIWTPIYSTCSRGDAFLYAQDCRKANMLNGYDFRYRVDVVKPIIKKVTI